MAFQARGKPRGKGPKPPPGPPSLSLPPEILTMFQARPPIEHKSPIEKRKMPPLIGIGEYVDELEDGPPPKRITQETPLQRKERIRQQKLKENEERILKQIQNYDPNEVNGENITENPHKTLFVARISYETSERKLLKEFERYGSVKRVRLVHDIEGKPRGYAFVEFEHEGEMREAMRKLDGRKIDGRRILVDVERGRTVSEWKPRRLGGGVGVSREAKPKGTKERRESSRDPYTERERDRDRDRDRDRYRDRDRDRDRDRHRDRDRDRDRHRDRDDRDRDHRYRD